MNLRVFHFGFLRHWGLVLAVAGVLYSFTSLGQEQSQKDEPFTIREDVNLVSLTATVTDQSRLYVKGLKKEDFVVSEDGVPQAIAVFESQEVPISIGIVFDTSGSMEDKIDDVQDAVKHFAKTVNQEDDIFLIRFSSDVDLVQDFTADRKRLNRAVDQLWARGSTRLYDAIAEALEKIRDGRHKKKAIVLITDGKDTASQVSLKEVLRLARRSEVLVYALGIGHAKSGFFGHVLGRSRDDEVDMKVLDGLAEATGGRSYFLEEAHSEGIDKIDMACLEVSAELRQQYTLGYYPSNKTKDGKYRKIRVTTRNPAYVVRTKEGYFAPMQVASG